MLDAIIDFFTGGDEAEQTTDDTVNAAQVDSPQRDMDAPGLDAAETASADTTNDVGDGGGGADGGSDIDAGGGEAGSWEAVLQGQVVLQTGATGAAVTEMQEKLTAAGNGVQATGEFGETTAEAVTAFQKAWGIQQNGTMGAQTGNALEEVVEWAKVANGELALRLGDSGPAVAFLQRGLKKLKYDVAHTGTFDEKTKAAVEQLQDNAGLGRDGVAGKNSASALVDMLKGGTGAGSADGPVDWLGGGANFQITHYTYAREDDPKHRNSPKIAAPGLNEKYRASFLGNPYGVKMQGTGLAENGKYIRWAGGGRYGYGVGGAFATVNKPYQQIAVDPTVVKKRSKVVVEPYRSKGLMSADDVGGAIKGNHIDVFVGPVNIDVAYALGTKYGRVGYPKAVEQKPAEPQPEGGDQKPLIEMSAGPTPWLARADDADEGQVPTGPGESGGGDVQNEGGETDQTSTAPENVPVPRPRPRPPLSQGWKKLMDGEIILERGDNGPTVEELQRRLDAAGFGLGVDGDYGQNTRNKVRAFQRSIGIKADGVVGKRTSEKLYQLTIGLWIDSAEGANGGAESDTDTSGGDPEQADGTSGADGSDGTVAAEPPASDTEPADNTPEVEPDESAAAANAGGEQTTAEGGETEAEQTTDDKNGASEHEEAYSAEWSQVVAGQALLKKGMKGDVVEELQRRLAAAGYETGVDGDFGNGTKKTVMELQSDLGQKADGVVGKDTAEAITQGTAWQAVVKGKLLLAKGAKGPAVKHLQLLLTRAGHGIQQTGTFGDTTEARVKDFQEENKIELTLKIGPTTAAKLQEVADKAGKAGFIWPMRGGKSFTSPWGPRSVKGGSSFHKGIDIQGNMSAGGTPIIAAATGTVTYAAFGANGGYGAMIDIEHDVQGKKFFTRYAHLAGIHVSTGQKVRQADHIGDEGGSGSRGANSYPYHLHFEIHDGSFNNKVDPLTYLTVPGDVQIAFGNSKARLERYGNYERSEDTSIWDY